MGAVEDIDNVIQKYITDRKVTSHQILSKEEFDSKKLIKDPTLLGGGYCFRKKKSSVNIYKKTVIEGKIWNGYKIDKVGKIGVLSEISIPIDDKLLPLITHEKLNKIEIIKNEKNYEEKVEIRTEPIILSQPAPGNYQHGQHVSFIQELKDKLERRRNSIMNIESPKKTKLVENTFTDSLFLGKNKLKHITPPPSPDFGLGRVLLNSESYDDWDTDSDDYVIQDDRQSLNDFDYDHDLPELTDFHDNILYEEPIYPIGDYDTGDYIEYYEGATNSNPLRRKFLETNRFSL